MANGNGYDHVEMKGGAKDGDGVRVEETKAEEDEDVMK